VFDTRRLDDLVLDYVIDDQCRMTGVPPDLERDRFTKPFIHRIYSPDGKLGEEMTGPDTDNWTSLDRISPFMQAAVLTTEDGAFFHHRGFNHLAIRNALLADLKARRFVRGASTVTMQLAKNLFLSRDKTLSRKLEELILTDYLEQAFTKDEMLELYLNVIEFGPNVYGITAASEHYFGRKPDELNLAECMFLSSILPKPVRYHYLYERGELSDSWLRGIRARMLIAQRTGKITEVELADGLTEAVVFHMPNTPRPPPRPPVAVVRSDGDEADLHEFN
jgi:membrane peptidoglycan carboxypeptidase